MQIEITLRPNSQDSMGFDYLYGMFSMLMANLEKHRPAFFSDLHEGSHKNKPKIFAFSPLNSMPRPEVVQRDTEQRGKLIYGDRVWFRIASPWPEALNAIGESLLVAERLNIAGKLFKVMGVKMIAPPEFKEAMVWRPFGQSASICTPWSPPGMGKKLFVYPDKVPEGSPNCAMLLSNNLVHKFRRLCEIRPDIIEAWLDGGQADEIPADPVQIEFLPLAEGRAYKPIMHYGKNTVIRTWRCPLKITAPVPLQRLAWGSGLGAMNSQGYGLVQEGKQC